MLNCNLLKQQDGKRIDLTNEDGINKLGNLIQENRDTDNERYYSCLEFFLRILLGGNYRMDVDHTDDRFVPSTLENIETSMRDPVYWQMIKRITNLMDKFKRTLKGYKTDDVDFNNVRIKNVNVDKLVTYFDYFDSDISNAVDMQLKNNTMLINNILNNINYDNNDNDCDRNGNCRRQNRNNNDRVLNKRFNNRDNFYNIDSNEITCDHHGKCCDHNGKCFNKNWDMNNNNWDMSNNNWDMNNKNWDMNNKNWDMNTKNWDTNNKNWDMNDNKRQMSNQRNWWDRADNFDESNGNTFKYNLIARQRRLTAKTFTVTVNIDSKVNQNGIVRIFLGPKIENKQQLNDNRKNFVEIDQFKVQLNQGDNTIRRNSRNFRNVVNDPITFTTLYNRAMNTKLNNQGTDMNDNNMETNNNNMGFPHRLVLPKGTVGGMDYTMFIIVTNTHGNTNSGLKHKINRNNYEGYNSDENSNEQDKYGKDFNYGMNSNKDSNERYGNMFNKYGRNINKNMNRNIIKNYWNTKNYRYEVNEDSNESSGSDERLGNMNNNRYSSDERYNTRNTNGKTMNIIKNRFANDWNNKLDLIDDTNKDNKMTINTCNGNKNSKLGLDNRALGFPLDREINNVNNFITDNMFFKDVKVYNMDMNNMNQFNMDHNNKY